MAWVKFQAMTWMLCLVCSVYLDAQNRASYFIRFKDKADSTYSLSHPEAFLSQRSLERRIRQQIPLSYSDLPVAPKYIKALRDLGVQVHFSSRWMNAALIEADEPTLNSIKILPFVLSSDLSSFERLSAKTGSKGLFKAAKSQLHSRRKFKPMHPLNPADYGASYNQVQMIGVDWLHQRSFHGENMLVAIFDAGFRNAPDVSSLKHLFTEHKIFFTYDFVSRETNVYDDDSHGLEVLSVMAANQIGSLIGTAYQASYVLCRTEDARSEYRIEEVNWLLAAEKADSLGVDVINSSLGYNTFDNSQMNYTRQDLNGNKALVTQAADLAASKGMLVVVSAGNEGDNAWATITAPADADSVLTIGAVNASGIYAPFSSVGPTADGRIKPDLTAQGSGTVLAFPFGGIGTSSGTSFSAPLVAGLVSCFWQANPQLTSQQVIAYLKRSGSQASKPDNFLGWGIPSPEKAQKLVEADKMKKEEKYTLFVNPVEESRLTIRLDKLFSEDPATIQLFDQSGKVVLNKKFPTPTQELVLSLPRLNTGTYMLRYQSSLLQFTEKVLYP
jgi:serine protease AprX